MLVTTINDLLSTVCRTASRFTVEPFTGERTSHEDLLLAQQHCIAAIGAAAQLDAHIAGVFEALHDEVLNDNH